MAQKRKRKNRKKLLFWLIMLVLVVVAVGVCYLVWQTYFSGDSGRQEDETSKTEDKQDEQDEINESNGEVTDENGDEIVIEGKEKVVQYEGGSPNKTQGLSGAITFAEEVDGKLVIRMNIDQYLSGGDCELVLKRGGGEIYRADADIDSGASTSTCRGFDVSINNIGRGGVDIEIYLRGSDGREGVIYGEVNI